MSLSPRRPVSRFPRGVLHCVHDHDVVGGSAALRRTRPRPWRGGRCERRAAGPGGRRRPWRGCAVRAVSAQNLRRCGARVSAAVFAALALCATPLAFAQLLGDEAPYFLWADAWTGTLDGKDQIERTMNQAGAYLKTASTVTARANVTFDQSSGLGFTASWSGDRQPCAGDLPRGHLPDGRRPGTRGRQQVRPRDGGAGRRLHLQRPGGRRAREDLHDRVQHLLTGAVRAPDGDPIGEHHRSGRQRSIGRHRP